MRTVHSMSRSVGAFAIAAGMAACTPAGPASTASGRSPGEVSNAVSNTSGGFGAAVTALAPMQGTPSASAAPETADTSDAVRRDLAKLRKATEPFRKIAAAEAAGYPATPMPQCIQHQPHGAMGHHVMAAKHVDNRLEVEHPEILTYERDANGTLQLTGVEYLIPLSEWKESRPPRIFGQDLRRSESLKIWYLHVWAWKENPSGLFADWNPTVKC